MLHMSDRYVSPDAMMRDYCRLNTEYQTKADKYIRNLMRIQRAENGEKAILNRIERRFKQENKGTGYTCSFCGRPETEAKRMIMGPQKVVICDECVELCGEILSEEGSADVE